MKAPFQPADEQRYSVANLMVLGAIMTAVIALAGFLTFATYTLI